jgi:hypothetical protein
MAASLSPEARVSPTHRRGRDRLRKVIGSRLDRGLDQRDPIRSSATGLQRRFPAQQPPVSAARWFGRHSRINRSPAGRRRGGGERHHSVPLQRRLQDRLQDFQARVSRRTPRRRLDTAASSTITTVSGTRVKERRCFAASPPLLKTLAVTSFFNRKCQWVNCATRHASITLMRLTSGVTFPAQARRLFRERHQRSA